MFALYLDIQKGKILEELDETEAKGRWKSFLGKWWGSHFVTSLLMFFLERKFGNKKSRMLYKDYANVLGIVESWLRGGMILLRCRKLYSLLRSRNLDRGVRSDRELWV
jgi:hypothetical protein